MCEMCGEDEKLFKTDIEGVDLNVCRNCGKFGKVRGPAKVILPKVKKVQTRQVSELMQVITDDYAKRISLARQKMGLKQKEFARIIKEKESVVQKIEQGQFEPSMRLARKLENHLRIKLVVQHEEKHEQKSKTGKTALTIGDMIEI